MSTTTEITTTFLTATTSGVYDIPKSVITILLLIGAFALAIIIAKVASYCYKRRKIPDDVSDMSDHTKDLLRKQLDLLRFGKKAAVLGKYTGENPEEEQKERTTHALQLWKSKVMQKAADEQNPAPKTGGEKQAAQNVEVVNETKGGKPVETKQANQTKTVNDTKKLANNQNSKPPSKTTKAPLKKSSSSNDVTAQGIDATKRGTSQAGKKPPATSNSQQKGSSSSRSAENKQPNLKFFSHTATAAIAAARLKSKAAAQKDEGEEIPPEVST